MSKKNKARHCVNCQITTEATVKSAYGSRPNVPSRKRKEEAKKTLYLNRV